jgi:hypothetical protein
LAGGRHEPANFCQKHDKKCRESDKKRKKLTFGEKQTRPAKANSGAALRASKPRAATALLDFGKTSQKNAVTTPLSKAPKAPKPGSKSGTPPPGRRRLPAPALRGRFGGAPGPADAQPVAEPGSKPLAHPLAKATAKPTVKRPAKGPAKGAAKGASEPVAGARPVERANGTEPGKGKASQGNEQGRGIDIHVAMRLVDATLANAIARTDLIDELARLSNTLATIVERLTANAIDAKR